MSINDILTELGQEVGGPLYEITLAIYYITKNMGSISNTAKNN